MRAILLLLSIVAGACSATPGRLVEVRISSPQPPLLSLASHWNLPGPLRKVEVDGSSYRTWIPVERMPLPFLDLNGNGQLDLDEEPVARCRKAQAWDCDIGTARLSVHRAQRPDGDATIAFGEVFASSTLAKDRTARLCLSDVGKCTDGLAPTPYTNSTSSVMLRVCDLTNVQEAVKEHEIELRSGDRMILKRRFHQPPAMNLETRLTAHRDGYRITGRAELPLHRVVVWSATLEQGTPKILWTSEARPDLMVRREREFEFLVPRAIVNGCPTCALGVQVVSDVEVGAVSISSEGVAVVMPKDFP